MSLMIVPITHADANAYVRDVHRHNKPTLGAIFCLAVVDEVAVELPLVHARHRVTIESQHALHGVAIAGRPVARALDDGLSIEVLRIATDGARNACSMLYGACRRAARALGYRRVLTYTLPHEGGASLRAAGFRLDGNAGRPSAHWGSSRLRAPQAVGDDLVGGKWRWVWP
jgi:hypothetical protein